jgi:hypothetical protein
LTVPRHSDRTKNPTSCTAHSSCRHLEDRPVRFSSRNRGQPPRRFRIDLRKPKDFKPNGCKIRAGHRFHLAQSRTSEPGFDKSQCGAVGGRLAVGRSELRNSLRASQWCSHAPIAHRELVQRPVPQRRQPHFYSNVTDILSVRSVLQRGWPSLTVAAGPKGFGRSRSV